MLQRQILALGRGLTWPFRAAAHGAAWMLRTVVAAAATTFGAIGRGISRLVNAVLDAVAGGFNAIGNGIAWVIYAILHVIFGVFNGISRGIKLIVRAILRSISQAMRRISDTVGNWVLRLRKATVTLSVEEGAMRVVVFRGQRVVGWDNVCFDTESEETAPDSPPPVDGAARLRALLAGLGVRRGRLVIDLPLYAPLMRYLQLPNVSGRYLEPTIVSEVLETIPFGADEVDIFWRRRRSGPGQEVIAVAVPRGNIDGQVRLAREAGLSPKAAYSKASALTLAAGFPDAIVIHLQPSEAAVVLVRSGSPRVVHQLDLPRDASHIQNTASTLVAAVDQVAGYYQSLDTELDSGSLPVVMTGQAPEESGLVEVLSRALGREVLPFAPALIFPADFPTGVYAANLGLYMAYTAKGNPRAKGASGIGPALNLLPERHVPQGLLPRQAFLAFLVLVLLTYGVFPATTQLEGVVRSVDNQASLLEGLKLSGALHDKEETAERNSRDELLKVTKQSNALQSLLDGLDGDVNTLLERLQLVTDTARPADVRLSSMTPEGNGYTLSGIAPSHQVILEYADNLRSSDLFADATVTQVTGSSQGTGQASQSFRIHATLTDKDQGGEAER